ncbi:N-acetylmuramoyl-L-alanine amidase-like domain-containing protein [Spirosoma montaniterrae]|uniref:Xylanase n=1 Tax=Spirosoma montaniterrae TaxID=1178516 RepID=A0A1P9WV99_9BACT|nr:N-acetylmuramoyl-L-alanine amidase-like domain-containing protein [Spirosoma montaniterrae]AQG79283.1 hypothetical protein AWR27_08060 [Spirosoma montaniterrae]
MTKRFTVFFLSLVSHLSLAQDLASIDLHPFYSAGEKTPGKTAVSIGRQLLAKPYVPHTLDVNPTEQLVVNLREFDCTTYLETVLALTLANHELRGKTNATALFEATFRRLLTQLRYRNGKIDGYASRLHYFSDWLYDNERKGLLTDITRELPGSMSVAKPVTYMTTATWKYPALRDPAVLKQMALTEAALSQQSFAFVPKKHVRQAEAALREGDIIMLTAARPGLDMKHVGLAVRQPNGRMHLLHASSEQGQVVITPYPISDYILNNRRLSGIRVARLRDATTGLATAFTKAD